MVKQIFLISVILFSQFLISQNKSLRIANQEYLKSNYSEVIDRYNKIKRTRYALQFSDYLKLAHSYYNIGDYLNSKIHYDKAFKKRTITTENHIFNYLHLSLVFNDSINYKKMSEKYNISENTIDRYLNTTNSDFLIDSLKVVDSLFNKFNYFQKDDNEYAQTIQNGYTKNLFKSKDSYDFKLMFDFDFDINEGQFAFTKKPNELLLTLNENNGKKIIYSNRKSLLKIYKFIQKDSLNYFLDLISLNQKKYNFSNPVFSNDFKRLYFVSDMKGGYGSTDIYFVDINNDDTFSEIKNLGPRINTSSREGYISIDSYNNLYFSSNGHSGYGGLDIYKVNLNDKNSFPVNIGSKINSNFDEFFFNVGDKNIYYSSNRNGEDKTYVLNYNLLEIDEIKAEVVIDNNKPVFENNFLNKKVEFLDTIEIKEIKKIKTNKFDDYNKSNSDLVVAEKKKYLVKSLPSQTKIKVFHVILGSFLKVKDADNLKENLSKKYNLNPKVLERTKLGFNRVSIKNFTSFKEAKNEVEKYIELGYLDAWIAVY